MSGLKHGLIMTITAGEWSRPHRHSQHDKRAVCPRNETNSKYCFIGDYVRLVSIFEWCVCISTSVRARAGFY